MPGLVVGLSRRRGQGVHLMLLTGGRDNGHDSAPVGNIRHDWNVALPDERPAFVRKLETRSKNRASSSRGQNEESI